MEGIMNNSKKVKDDYMRIRLEVAKQNEAVVFQLIQLCFGKFQKKFCFSSPKLPIFEENMLVLLKEQLYRKQEDVYEERQNYLRLLVDSLEIQEIMDEALQYRMLERDFDYNKDFPKIREQIHNKCLEVSLVKINKELIGGEKEKWVGFLGQKINERVLKVMYANCSRQKLSDEAKK